MTTQLPRPGLAGVAAVEVSADTISPVTAALRLHDQDRLAFIHHPFRPSEYRDIDKAPINDAAAFSNETIAVARIPCPNQYYLA